MAGFETPKTCKPTKFIFFPLLATEIRLKIWAYALPGPRVVDIHYDVRTNLFAELSKPVESHLVHVNEEAREVVFKHYSAWFGTEIQYPLIYADTKIDVIKLNFDAFRFWKLKDEEYSIIRHLELSDREMHKIDAMELIIRLGMMPNLTQLTVVDPRSPFIMRPYPTAPTVINPESLWKYCMARGQFYLGLALERRCVRVWDQLLKIDKAARKGQYGLSNFTTGMVGVTADGVRRYCMVDVPAEEEAE